MKKIVDFTCNDDLTITLKFDDGVVRKIDVGGFIRKHPHLQYNKYLKLENFKKVRLENGNIVWGNDLEFHIEYLYDGVIL